MKSGIAAFDAICAETAKFTRETPADLRAHGFKHFAFGDLDAYQWLLRSVRITSVTLGRSRK